MTAPVIAIFVVSSYDGDNESIEAHYATQALADAHCAAVNVGLTPVDYNFCVVTGIEASSTLPVFEIVYQVSVLAPKNQVPRVHDWDTEFPIRPLRLVNIDPVTPEVPIRVQSNDQVWLSRGTDLAAVIAAYQKMMDNLAG